MKKCLKIILIVFVLLIILVMVFWVLSSKPESKFVCEVDSDCAFHYTAYSEDHLCPSCFYADEEWICMNIEKAEEELRKTMNELHGVPYLPLCERCFENDYDSYSCECVDNKCAKSPK